MRSNGVVTIDPHLAPHWATAALVTIDMQRDFLFGSYTVPGTAEALPEISRLASAFRAAGKPIVHVVRLYQGDDVDRVRRGLVDSGVDFVRPGTPGRLLAPGLAPDVDLDDELLLEGQPQILGRDEYALFKPRWGAFYRTPLAEVLDGHGLDTVVFAGCNMPNCPRASIIEAHERDFRVVLAADAISNSSEQGFREIAGIGTVLMPVADIVDALR